MWSISITLLCIIHTVDKEFKTPKPVNYRRNSLWYLPKKTESDDWNPGRHERTTLYVNYTHSVLTMSGQELKLLYILLILGQAMS